MFNNFFKEATSQELYPYQERLLQQLEDNNFNVCAKFRQGGFTTLALLYSLWKCTQNENYNALYVTRTERDMQDLMQIAQKFLNNVSKKFISKTYSINLENNNSSLTFITPTAHLGRHYNHIVIDEASLMDNEDWFHIFIPMSTTVLIMGTPVKAKGDFYQLYMDAEAGNNKFKVFKCSYKECLNFTPERIEELKRSMSPEQFAQEIEAKFTREIVCSPKLPPATKDSKIVLKLKTDEWHQLIIEYSQGKTNYFLDGSEVKEIGVTSL